MRSLAIEECELKADEWNNSKMIKKFKRSRFIKPDNISNLDWYCYLIEEKIRYRQIINDVQNEV